MLRLDPARRVPQPLRHDRRQALRQRILEREPEIDVVLVVQDDRRVSGRLGDVQRDVLGCAELGQRREGQRESDLLLQLPLKVMRRARLSLTMEPLEQLYRDRCVGFRNALAPLCGSQEAAHDVVQEAFAIALRKRRQLRRAGSLAPWVWRIAYRLALRERRRRTEEALPEDLTILDPERDPALNAAIRSLPPKRRLVLFLRYFAGFSYAEIAAALEISEGTVAATLAQAHAALHDDLVEVAR